MIFILQYSNKPTYTSIYPVYAVFHGTLKQAQEWCEKKNQHTIPGYEYSAERHDEVRELFPDRKPQVSHFGYSAYTALCGAQPKWNAVSNIDFVTCKLCKRIIAKLKTPEAVANYISIRENKRKYKGKAGAPV